jgi:hypothetical protein
MLEEPADQFLGRQIGVGPLASLTGTERPADLALGPELHAAIGRGGFEHVAREVTQSVLSGPGGSDVEVPALAPDFLGDLRVEFRRALLEFLGEESAEAVDQGLIGEEELFAGVDPGAPVQRQPAAGNQIMQVG